MLHKEFCSCSELKTSTLFKTRFKANAHVCLYLLGASLGDKALGRVAGDLFGAFFLEIRVGSATGTALAGFSLVRQLKTSTLFKTIG